MADKKNNLIRIRQEAFLQAREKRGLSQKDLANLACLSARQIQQIENGEHDAFYGLHIKISAAKKIAQLLEMEEEDAFYGGALDNSSEPDVQLHSREVDLEKISVDAMLLSKKPKKLLSKAKVLGVLSLAAVVIFSIINLPTVFFERPKEAILLIQEKGVQASAISAGVNQSEAVTNSASNSDQVPVVVAGLSSSPLQEVINIAAPVDPAVQPSLTTASTGGITCPVADKQIQAYRAVSPRKAGDMVYVQAKKGQVVCIEDSAGKIQQKTLDAGVGASFFGRPPFKLMTADLSQVDMFFQGMRVHPENRQGRTLLLESVDIATPADPPDSVLR